MGKIGMPRQVVVLSVSAFIIALGFGVLIPVLPLFARGMDATAFQIGLVVSAFAAMRLVGAPFTDRVMNWMGRRNALAVGMLGVAASSAISAFSQNIWQLIIFRSLGGFGSVLFSVAAMSVLLSSVPASQRGQASGLYQGGFLLGSMAGPAIGGLLTAISLRAPFLFFAAMLLVAGLVCFALIREPDPRPSEAGVAPKPRPMRKVIRDVGYQAACVTAFGQGWQSIGARSTLVPLLIVGSLQADAVWSGIAFAASAVAQAVFLLPMGIATDRWGRKPVMILAGTLTALASVLIPFSTNVWWLTAALCLYSIGGAAQGTGPTAAVGDAAGSGSGKPIAMFSMIADFGAILGPLIAGLLTDTVSISAAFFAGAVVLLAGAVYALFMPKPISAG